MKKVFMIIFAVIFICSSGLCVMAEYLPVFDDFEEESYKALDGWSYNWTQATPKHYVRLEEGKMVLSAGARANTNGTANETDTAMTKTLDVPIVNDTVYIEFKLTIPEGCIIKSWWGVPYILDSEGTRTGVMRFNGTMGTTGAYLATGTDSNSYIVNANWETEKEYDIKIEINLENKTFKVYIDGVLAQRADGTDTHTYNGIDVKKVVFNVVNGATTDAKIYVDDFSIHTKSVIAFYVAEDGSDSNDGSINNPFKTIDKAVEKAKEKENSYIVLKSGTYKAPAGTMFGGEDINLNSKTLNFYTMPNAEVVIEGLNENGSLLADINSINIKDDFKNKLKEKISTRYVKNFSVFPLIYGYATRTVTDGVLTTNMSVFNNSETGYPLQFISAIYRKGVLKDVKIADVLLETGNNAVDIVHDNTYIQTDTDMHRLFVWDGVTGIRPVHTVVYDVNSTNASNVSFASIDSVKLNDGDVLTVKGSTTSDMRLTIRVEDGTRLIYLDQVEVSAGDFEKQCKIRTTWVDSGLAVVISGESL